MTDSKAFVEKTGIELRFSDTELEAYREHIVQFIADLVETAGTDGAVMGLSGGIDSTTVAHLAVEALGAENVHGLVLPSSVNPDADETDAEQVAETLGIEYDTI